MKSSNLCHQPSVSTPGESVQSPLRTAVEPTNQLSPDSSSANQISPNSSLRRVSEKPLAFGYWAKPQGLKGATSDFLCVQAALRGSADPSSPAYQLGKCHDVIVTFRLLVFENLIDHFTFKPLYDSELCFSLYFREFPSIVNV